MGTNECCAAHVTLMEHFGWTVSYDQALSPRFTKGEFAITYVPNMNPHLHRGDKGGWYLFKNICRENGSDRLTFHNALKQHRYITLADLLLSVACAGPRMPHFSDLVNGYTPDQLRKLIDGAQEAL